MVRVFFSPLSLLSLSSLSLLSKPHTRILVAILPNRTKKQGNKMRTSMVQKTISFPKSIRVSNFLVTWRVILLNNLSNTDSGTSISSTWLSKSSTKRTTKPFVAMFSASAPKGLKSAMAGRMTSAIWVVAALAPHMKNIKCRSNRSTLGCVCVLTRRGPGNCVFVSQPCE